MDNVVLYTKLATLPENLKPEVSDFIDSLLRKTKIRKKFKYPKAKVWKYQRHVQG